MRCTCTWACRHDADPTTGVDVCWKKQYDKDWECFNQGRILRVPFHVSNMDPYLSWDDRKLTLSKAGPVYSKYRLVVVFRKFQTQMECLPFYTHNGKGVTCKTVEEKKEWVSVMDESEGVPQIEDEGRTLTMLLDDKEKVRPNACLHITESVMVEYAENIRDVGKLEWSSFEQLHKLRAALDESAEDQFW